MRTPESGEGGEWVKPHVDKHTAQGDKKTDICWCPLQSLNGNIDAHLLQLSERQLKTSPKKTDIFVLLPPQKRTPHNFQETKLFNMSDTKRSSFNVRPINQ